MSPKSSARRQLIVDAAHRRFTTFGYEGTTIGDLATELDISKAAIAYYFPTKETFLDEFVEPFVTSLAEAVAAAESPDDTLRAYLSVIVADHETAVWIDTDPTIQNHVEYGPRLADINRKVTKMLTGGSRRKADHIRALGVLGGLWRPAREISTDDLIDHFDEIVEAALTSS